MIRLCFNSSPPPGPGSGGWGGCSGGLYPPSGVKLVPKKVFYEVVGVRGFLFTVGQDILGQVTGMNDKKTRIFIDIGLDQETIFWTSLQQGRRYEKGQFVKARVCQPHIVKEEGRYWVELDQPIQYSDDMVLKSLSFTRWREKFEGLQGLKKERKVLSGVVIGNNAGLASVGLGKIGDGILFNAAPTIRRDDKINVMIGDVVFDWKKVISIRLEMA